MIVSVNWLKKFTDIDLPIDEMATLIGARLVEIEQIIDLGIKYKNIIVVKVVECAPLEDADHLSLTKIDDGNVARDVERDKNGLVQVICGATNVRVGMLAAWLPPGSTVPSTVNSPEPFVLTVKDLRGTISNGMLASPKELDLYDEHTGILELDGDLKPGTDFATAYELDDYLFDIENKSLTHRPDTFGIIGFAREVAAIQGRSFVTPEWLIPVDLSDSEKVGNVPTPSVSIDDPELSERYQVVVLSGADSSRKSPVEIQTYLARVGVRPINAVVDATNYLMMLTGQPLHAFDYDKILDLAGGKAEIHVRSAKEGEKLEILDGRTIELSPADIVIAAGDVAVGLAGAMGGANTIIDSGTKNIILESATFNLYNLRATQMRHGIFSEAITRFTKGQPAELSTPVLADAMRLLGEWSGAVRASDIAKAHGKSDENPSITITADQVNKVLGTDLTIDDIETIFRMVEFASAQVDKSTLTVSPPYWRSDVHRLEDLIEEVGRLRGFDSIAPTLPARDFTAVAPNSFDVFRASLRSSLVRAGANEILSYSFVHGDILTRASQKLEDSYRLTNSLSPDLQHYRQSLTPNLLQLVHPNIRSGFDEFALFELNKTHSKQRGLTNESVPDEADNVALVVASKTKLSGAPYYRAKRILDFIGATQGLDLVYEPIDQETNHPTAAPFEYRRSAVVKDKVSGEKLGIVGEYKKSVIKSFKLPEFIAGFELDTNAVFSAVQKQEASYRPLSRYPSAERDICLQVKNDVSYGQIVSAMEAALKSGDLEATITPVDIYEPEDGQTKNITIRIKLISYDHTLVSEEITATMASAIDMVVTSLSAKVI